MCKCTHACTHTHTHTPSYLIKWNPFPVKKTASADTHLKSWNDVSLHHITRRHGIDNLWLQRTQRVKDERDFNGLLCRPRASISLRFLYNNLGSISIFNRFLRWSLILKFENKRFIVLKFIHLYLHNRYIQSHWSYYE